MNEPDLEVVITYFEKSLHIFKKYAWIYNFPVTDLLVLRVLDDLSSEWRDSLESLNTDDFNYLALGEIKGHWPQNLKDFAKNCLDIRFKANKVNSSQENFKSKGMSAKKSMEVSILSSLIDTECRSLDTTHIVDLGCGLGHLDQILSDKFGYHVLGLESESSFVKTAQSNKPNSKVTIVQLDVKGGTDGANEVSEIVNKWLLETGGHKACLIGLHTCGNLAATTLSLFTLCSSFSNLVVTPCCFHKLDIESSGDEEETFSFFPVSCHLKHSVDKVEGRKFLRRPFLRLASQMSASKWSKMSDVEHRQHSMHVLTRAALQVYAKKEDLTIKKAKRKALNKSSLGVGCDQMVQNLVERYQLFDKEGTIVCGSDVELMVGNLCQKYWKDLHLIEGLTALQCCLQEPADRLLFSDMQQFLSEHNLHQNRVELLWDEALSPRSHAIIASRNHTS